MTGSPSKAMDAARILSARRLSGEQGARLPEGCRPQSLDEAFDVQAAVTQQLSARIGAWKCALPLEGRLTAAPIYANKVHTGSPCAVFAQDGCVRVEPELAFILRQDLPARASPYSQAEVDDAIARTHIALELIDGRYTPAEAAQASFAEKLADGLVNQGLFLGPEVDAVWSSAATDLAIRVRQASGAERLHKGRHPNVLPRSPLYWLVEFLRSRGQGLHAGQAVITGSYAGSFTLPLNEDIAIQYGDLGGLTVHFTRLTMGQFSEPSSQQ
ncbi:fumarylacetoacetate hydrolase family protein [Aquabacterium sp.]|uniref:fumarylacetoacetate hydrolase family protein n=1 Tax=Aquabacterium sp. TaxID=1872578 RepID=UPI0019827AD7|nr:fumarylacetoacetate hydrolase family protein [Aquabacterium sp.]MBC7700420.1 fumarylacetoacetate hydrolase family protein [Aquabacterium sp.]